MKEMRGVGGSGIALVVQQQVCVPQDFVLYIESGFKHWQSCCGYQCSGFISAQPV